MTSVANHAVSTTLYECEHCGESSATTHHDCHPSKPPVIHVDGRWICSRCGVTINPVSSCFNCGRAANVSQIKVGLDLGLQESTQDVEKEIHAEINRRRRSEGHDSVQWDQHLSIIGLRHSRDMAERDYFSHTTPEGMSASDRAKQVNYGYRRISENISLQTVDPTMSVTCVAEEIVDGWIDSSGHRENVFDSKVTHHGVGCYIDGAQIYVTENFAQPNSSVH